MLLGNSTGAETWGTFSSGFSKVMIPHKVSPLQWTLYVNKYQINFEKKNLYDVKVLIHYRDRKIIENVSFFYDLYQRERSHN